MENRDFEELGEKVQELIDNAVRSQNYQQLNQTISQAVNDGISKAIDNGSDALRDALKNAFGVDKGERYKQYRYQVPDSFRKQQAIEKAETKPQLYMKGNAETVKGGFLTAIGAVICGGSGIGILASGLVQAFTNSGGGFPVMLTVLCAAGVGLIVTGINKINQMSRFKKYVKQLGGRTYCDFEKLSKVAGKPVTFVKKDVKSMIQKGWFLEGHVDDQETCLITSDETYSQYKETQAQLELRKQEESKKKTKITPEVQEILNKGNDYLDRIHKSNDAIPGEEISEKIASMENIVKRILERAEEHPEICGDLKKMMNYYLPMTIKLLDAYEEMDAQPIQGENIRSSKKEIEETLDTLNDAYEKLLDTVFMETALDVSTDISVLQTLLAQEGLTEDDIQKRNRTGQASAAQQVELKL